MLTMPGAPPAFHLLAKPSGAICNLDCDYCYFLSKERLYPGARFRMSDEVLEAYIAQLLDAHRGPEVTVAWQGGEPTLMGLDFFRRSVALVERHRRPGQRVAYTVQTNGTLVDDAWASFFKEHGFLVGLSVDGPADLHDAYRVDKKGDGSFERVMRGWDALRAREVDVNVVGTVHAANADHPLRVYRFFRDEMGARFLQFIPIVERVPDPSAPAVIPPGASGTARQRPLYTQTGSRVTDRSVGAAQYGRFLIAIFDEWLRGDVGEVYVQDFDVALANWHGEPPGLCVFSETCGRSLALEHNGDLYSCDHYVEPAYRLGNILQRPLLELVASEPQRQFGLKKRASLPEFCRSCDVRFACHGGCPKDRFIRTPDGEDGLNYLCAGYKAFFQHIDRPMRVMSRLLREGRAPAEASRVLGWHQNERPHRMLAE